MSALIVMGVSGSGKTTLGIALAQRLGFRFIEGDTLHPQANIDKMRGGTPLDDEDRIPWLETVAHALREARAGGVVVSCSALKRKHRDFLRAQAGELGLVLPVLAREQLAARVRDRPGHFMPFSLLESQLADFQQPDSDESPILVPGTLAIEEQVDEVLQVLDSRRTTTGVAT